MFFYLKGITNVTTYFITKSHLELMLSHSCCISLYVHTCKPGSEDGSGCKVMLLPRKSEKKGRLCCAHTHTHIYIRVAPASFAFVRPSPSPYFHRPPPPIQFLLSLSLVRPSLGPSQVSQSKKKRKGGRQCAKPKRACYGGGGEGSGCCVLVVALLGEGGGSSFHVGAIFAIHPHVK